MVDSSPAPRRFAFISQTGWGNLGDAAIVDSLIHGLRSRVPGAEIVGYTMNPPDTATRHGIAAHPILGFSLPYYPVIQQQDDPGFELPPFDGTQAPPPPRDARRPQDIVRSFLRSHMWSVRAVGLAIGSLRARHDRRPRREQRAELAGTDAVIVAGGGQLDALFGGVWGQPYALLRWARLARAVGARFLVLSVGTGSLDALERRVTIRALRLADHRSYRDARSRSMLRSPRLTADDPIVPDLAYALPAAAQPLPPGDRIVVAVSPMNYQHPDFYPAADPARYEQHIAGMHRICVRLLDRGHHVVLFTTDASDDVGLADLQRRLLQSSGDLGDRWTVAGARTVSELMTMYDTVHAVVASRLHGALLAHVAGRPVLALAHERKVRTLMADAGHERFCFDLGGVDDLDLDDRLDELIDRREQLALEAAASAAVQRRLVDLQYDQVFGRAALPPTNE